MPTVEDTTTINRSPADVWDYITQTENVMTFEEQTAYLDQLTPGEIQIGTRWQGATNVLGRNIEWATEAVDLEPHRLLRMKSYEGKIAFEVTYTLRPDPDELTTEFTYRIEAEPGLGGLFGKLTDPFVQRAYARTVRGNITTLKELLEAGV